MMVRALQTHGCPRIDAALTSVGVQAANSMSVMSNALPEIASSLQRNVPLVTKSENEDEKSNRRRMRSRRQGSKSADPKLSENKRRVEVQNAILQNASNA